MIELNICPQCIFCKAPYPGAVCDEGVYVVFGLVVVKQTAPGDRLGDTLSLTQCYKASPLAAFKR